MAVNFGLLQPAAPVSAFFQGQQDVRAEADRNMLRQQQAEKLQFERENMLAQRSDREAQAKLRGQQELELRSRMERAAREEGYLNKVSELFANNGMPLNLKTAQEGLSYAIKSGDKNAIDMMNRTVASLQEREALQAAFGGQAAPAAAPSMMRQPPAVAAPAAAPTNMFAGTIADIGTTQPAPVNALAAPPQLTAPAAGAMSREYLQSIILNPNAPPAAVARAKAVLASMPQAPAPAAPSEVVKLNRELAAANAAGDTALAADLKARITRLTEKPVGTTIVNKLPPQQGAFESGLGKGQSERVLKDQEVAQDAVSIIDTVRQGRQLLQSGMITGFGAEALTQIGALLNQAGINFAEDAVANTQAFSANMAQNVGRIIKQFGAGTGLSNADREYAEKMAGGKITLDRKAIERILDINERAARNVIALHNKRVSGIKTNVPLTVDVPAGPPAPAPIPTAPPATAAPRPTARQVLRTGKLNGRKVVEYTDGSVEYAD